ncbi:MAG: hypothetical protein RLZZ42_1059, partial [Bacteroidota bacterium]
MNKLMNLRNNLLPVFLLLLSFSYTSLFAASGHMKSSLRLAVDRIVFSGKILNERGEGLPGCTINEKGQKSTILSKADGSFSIEVSGL